MKRLLLVLVAMLVLGGTACANRGDGGGSGGGGGAGGKLTIFGDDPPTLDPALTSDTSSSLYVNEIFGGLITLNRQLRITPDIAETWEVSPDGKTYTFKLKKTAKFHSGKDVTAKDFQYSFERAAEAKLGSHTADTYLGDIKGLLDKLAGKATSVSGIKVVDDYTLQLEIEGARSYFLAKMSYPTSFVVDKENVDGGGRNWTDKPNGTGPFKLQEWKKSERIVLARNPSFHLDPAKLDSVNFLLAGGSAMTMYENNEVDITGVNINDMERISDPSNPLSKEFVVAPSLDVWYIGFNVEVPPFDDPKVRQAFNYGVDKDKIISVVLKGLYQRADGVMPPGLPGYNPNIKDKGLKFDIAKAKAALAASKYGSSLPPITFTIPSSSTTVDPVTEAITQQFKTNLGIDVKVQQVEWATFLGDLKRNPNQNKKNKYQMYELGWSADYPDPQDFVDILFHSKSLQNNETYNNPQVDKLLDQARSENNDDKRFQLYQQAEMMIVEDAPWIPLYHGKHYQLVKPRVKDYAPSPMSMPTFRYVSIQ